MDFHAQEALASYVHETLTEQIERVDNLTRSLNATQRRQPRADGGWSIDQILAHLARMNETYLERLEQMPSESAAHRTGDRGWSPSIGGRMLRWTGRTSLSLKTPKIFGPEALDISGDPLDAFLKSHRALLEMLGRLRDLDWSVLRCCSPASSLVRLNPGDVFLVLAEHADRHMKQLEQQRDAVVGAEESSSTACSET